MLAICNSCSSSFLFFFSRPNRSSKTYNCYCKALSNLQCICPECFDVVVHQKDHRSCLSIYISGTSSSVVAGDTKESVFKSD
jgi:hypothetical protein